MVIVVAVWTGSEARALRMALRMTVLGFAEHLGVGSRTVSDWEAGSAKIVPTPVMQEVLDTALSRASDEAKVRFARLTSGNSVVCVSDSLGHNGNGDHTDRRQAGKTIVMGGVAALFPREVVERITGHGGRPVDSKLITAHEDIADAFARAHSSTQHDVLLDQVAHQAGKLLWLLDRPMATTERRRLDALVVSTHAQAGLLAFNLADRAAARRYFATAQSVADDAGDDTLRAQAHAMARQLHTPLVTGGHRGDVRCAVTRMREAVHHARRADPVTRACTYRWLGLDLAVDGDERGFLESFDAAERLPERMDALDNRGFLPRYMAMDPTRVIGNRGRGLVHLGHVEEGVKALVSWMVGAWPGHRVIALADIALARVLQGEPEQACQDLQHALDLALDAGYAMGVERIRGVRARFPEPWVRLACVQELDERLALTALNGHGLVTDS